MKAQRIPTISDNSEAARLVELCRSGVLTARKDEGGIKLFSRSGALQARVGPKVEYLFASFTGAK